MQKPVSVYIEYDSKGLRFVLDFVFNTWFGTGYVLVQQKPRINPGEPLLNYSSQAIPGAYHVFQSLSSFGLDALGIEKPVIQYWEGLPCFFYQGVGDVPFDLFRAVFVLLTRVEEYQPGERDDHGRFLSTHSVFSDTGLIERPIIDEWLMKLGEKIMEQHPGFNHSKRQYKWLNTIDIDVAYAYKYRPWYRLLGAAVRDLITLNFSNFFRRLAVLSGAQSDPYDTYDLLLERAPTNADNTIFFMLLGDWGRHDKSLSHKSTGIRNLVASLSHRARVGIHPSYASNEQLGILDKELSRLCETLGSDVTLSRQHYLKVSIPHTYRRLVAAGIKEDYSLGYSDKPGFRSGTCTPYFFYDVELDENTVLKVFPLVAMDASLRDYMGLEPETATQLLSELIAKVKRAGGTFISLWHNESVSDVAEWEGWREVYTKMADEAAS